MRRIASGSPVAPSVVLLACLVVFGGCASVMESLRNMDTPSARVAGVRLDGLDFETATLVFDIEISNPLGVAVPLVDLDLGLDTGGQRFAAATLPLTGTVAAGGRRTVPCPVEIDLVQTLRTLGSVRPGSVIDYRAELGLSIDVPALGRQRLPLTHDGRLPFPAIPRLSVETFRMDDVGLSGVTGTAVLRVGNPNDFAVGLDALDVDLRLGGRDVAGLGARAPLALAENGEGTLELPLNLSTMDLGTALLQIFRGASADYGLQGGASLSTPFGDLRAPIDVSGDAPIVR